MVYSVECAIRSGSDHQITTIKMMKFAILLIVGVIIRLTYADEPEAIVGGYDAVPGQFRHQVSIQCMGAHMCGGSMISDRHILTAAHCILDDEKWKNCIIVTGDINWKKGEKHSIECVQVHPEYDNKSNIINNDIAVITLASPIKNNSLQSPIRLASKDYAIGDQDCMLSGWGNTRTISRTPTILKYLAVKTISLSKCRERYTYAKITENQICTYEGFKKGACRGDSGGPLSCDGELAGVVSWGIPCAWGLPDVFTSVLKYREWIQQCQEKC